MNYIVDNAMINDTLNLKNTIIALRKNANSTKTL